MRAANLALKFALELGAIAAFAYWGANTGDGDVLPLVLAMVTPAVVIVLWGLYAAPKSGRRLPTGARIPFELGVFALAAAALAATGAAAVAVGFATLAVVNAAMLTALGQWAE